MSKTTENLKAAFAGESQARNKYTFFAKVARKEGYHYIAKIFEETAENEMQHAKDHLKLLNGIGDTAANLKEAFGGEDHEVESMYPEFAKTAIDEGFKDIADIFMAIAVAEKQHEKRYKDLAANIEAGRVFRRPEKTTWRCRNCGYLEEGAEAPTVCPACDHPQAHFELLGENW